MVKRFSELPLFDPADGVTVVPPPGEGPGYWAGGPTACYDAARGRLVLCYRLRRPIGLGRGYRCVVAESSDGLDFAPVWELDSREWGTDSIERSALVKDPDGGWSLYISSVDPADNRWRIDLLRASDPAGINVGRRQAVMTAASTGTEGVKDPVVWLMEGRTWMLVPYGPGTGADLTALHATGNIFATGRYPHPTALARSDDGVRVRWLGDALVPGASRRAGADSEGGSGSRLKAVAWDSAVTRASALVYRTPTWHLFYDGRTGEGDIYEDRTGLALSSDCRSWKKVSVDGPVLQSPWGTGSLRYLSVVSLPGRTLFYYECCRPDGAHELRANLVEE